jgi:hypothetical protein
MDNNTIRTKILELFKNDSLTNAETQLLLAAVETEKCIDLTLGLYKKDLLTLEECDSFLRHFETLNMGRLFVKNLEKSRETILKKFSNEKPYSPYVHNPILPPFKVTF